MGYHSFGPRAPERVLGMVLVAPALPTNERGGPPSRRSLSWQLRMAYSRALLQVLRIMMTGPYCHVDVRLEQQQ